jgi:hypothetical protein
MNLRAGTIVGLAFILSLVVAIDRASAALLCVSPHGLVRLRTKCKRKEKVTDPATIGLQVPGPQGPTGPTGVPGAMGATGLSGAAGPTGGPA